MKKQINKSITLALLASALVFVSCGSTKSKSFPKMYSENPLVMLIMPPINNTSNVEAKDFFYTTLNVPIAESGYYVLPPAMTMATLQKESAYDSENFIEGDLSKFAEIFGADAAVFTIIRQWDKVLVSNEIVIEVEYLIKSAKTNEILFDRNAEITYKISSGSSGQGLVGALATTLADTIDMALTDYIDVAVECNDSALGDIPYGKYHPKHGTDGGEPAFAKKIQIEKKK